MRRGFGWVIVSAWLQVLLVLPVLLGGCTSRAETVRAAQPYVLDFGEQRLRALKLLELRADVQRKRLLAAAMQGDEDSLPSNLKPVLERMRSEGVVLDDKQIEHGEAAFWRMFDYTFTENPNVLQAELIFIEKGGSITSFRHPRESELPVGVKWHGLRQNRTFAGLTSCVTEAGSEPCVLLQLRPREYPGSAGLTVAYRRTPLEVNGDADSDR